MHRLECEGNKVVGVLVSLASLCPLALRRLLRARHYAAHADHVLSASWGPGGATGGLAAGSAAVRAGEWSRAEQSAAAMRNLPFQAEEAQPFHVRKRVRK